MEYFIYPKTGDVLTDDEIRIALLHATANLRPKKVLLIPPDFTRYYSNAGFITNVYYHAFREQGAEVDVLPALGSHEPVSREQADIMFGDIPYETLIPHRWRTDVVTIGQVPADFLSEVSGGLWNEPIAVEINRRLLDPSYDLILSIGQVVPHEVVGMGNHSKNLFVGTGGSEMINHSHMLGALCGLENIIGRDHTAVRRLFDYAYQHFLSDQPIQFVLTVTTAPGNEICTHGLFIGDTRLVLEKAIAISQEQNITFLDKSLKKCVVFMDPVEFQSTWIGNKAVYRTRMAIDDGGELIILAPGIHEFGEDKEIDRLICNYGYHGTKATMDALKKPGNQDLRDNMGAAAHLIHASTDGRFSVTYAVKNISLQAIRDVGFQAADYDETAARYNPETLRYGYNTMPDGEEIFFIPNPALGLWISRQRFPKS